MATAQTIVASGRYRFGVVEIALAVCLFLGRFKTISYGAAMGLHAVSVPVFAAFVALFLLRGLDHGIATTQS
jgi:hypothetical protein